jgi:hypothetical protein
MHAVIRNVHLIAWNLLAFFAEHDCDAKAT